MRLFVLNENFEPVECDDIRTWALWYCHAPAVIVADNEVRGMRITTAFVGIDPGWRPDHVPLLYETKIIGGEHDHRRWAYSSRASALAGHREIVLWAVSGAEGPHP